ncbi:MAG TPA: hypothetical protein VGR63_15690 [Casimicrobiaceae bacterium]|nr:hypothetical protein [Casimicrobiaceae bacterium]
MGVLMMQDDIYIASLFDLMNLRFGPSEGLTPEEVGGIDEMVRLQKDFRIVREGRSFRDTAAILNLGGFWNARSKNRWLNLLDSLKKVDSNRSNLKGDPAIVAALIADLESPSPLPVHFTSHDLRDDNRVLIDEPRMAVSYIDRPYLSISLPMKPRPK